MGEWKVGDKFHNQLNGYAITSDDALLAVATYRGGTEPARMAAEKIVKAVNNHDRLCEALQQLVDYVKDGCPDDGRYYVMTEAQAALKGIRIAVVPSQKSAPPEGASHNSGERLPSSDAAVGGADTSMSPSHSETP